MLLQIGIGIGFVFKSKDRTQDKIGGEEINKKNTV